MSNQFRVKRSVANDTIPTLANGELAYTQASNTLWIGLPDGSGNAREVQTHMYNLMMVAD